MKKEVKQGAGLKNPSERMGNCLRRRRFRQVIKRRKKEFHEESEEVSPSYYQESHEDHEKEPLYALITHMPQRMPSINSTEDDYENVGPKHKRTKPPAPRNETEYAVLRVPSSPQPSHSFQDEEYELIMPLPIPLQPDELKEPEYIGISKNRK
ncbi:germinal center-associated signaling and motility protein isoform X2 [Phascolarctos cinereus]|uniref:Germinal center-associated signaling and motility protein isoform X2 n=1 Tax=Phascolarctos cinereus TaxID=38626 RepID=A0A6P5LWB7_PHACI|nr:germinal center-associated signaling and motility protein isoform X2 [Phascolarctos cinereus]